MVFYFVYVLVISFAFAAPFYYTYRSFTKLPNRRPHLRATG